MKSSVLTVIIIPSYNETLALPHLLRELELGLTRQDAVIVMDDSPTGISNEIERKCLEVLKTAEFEFKFEKTGLRSGRGAAVRRGMIKALSDYPNLREVLECDADGSHRPEDILKIKNSLSEADLLVGSRYLKTSKILGWSVNRRMFSWILNKVIPQFTGVKLKDITNGLRRYSKNAINVILSENQQNKGFIYLSEQAILISRAGMILSEEPIIFVNRTLGKSTVTWQEISNSLYGILKLVFANSKND